MKYRCIFVLAVFIILIALSIAMQTGAVALTRTDEKTLTLTEQEAKYCGAVNGDPEKGCILVNKVLIEAEIAKRVRQALEVCRSYTKGET